MKPRIKQRRATGDYHVFEVELAGGTLLIRVSAISVMTTGRHPLDLMWEHVKHMTGK